MWLLLIKRLPTSSMLYYRKIISSPLCPHCNVVEDTEHIFLHCPRNNIIWNTLHIDFEPPNFSMWVKELCTSNSSITLPNQIQVPLSIITPITLWHIWLHRNNNLFKKLSATITNNTPIAQPIEYLCLTSQKAAQQQTTRIQVRWEPPPPNIYKLSIDNAHKKNSNYGGVR